MYASKPVISMWLIDNCLGVTLFLSANTTCFFATATELKTGILTQNFTYVSDKRFGSTKLQTTHLSS